MTTNIVELLNSILMDEWEYPVLYIFNSIARKFGEKFRERYAFVNGKENIFMPYAKNILRDIKSVSDSLYVSNPNGVLDQYTVLDNDVTASAPMRFHRVAVPFQFATKVATRFLPHRAIKKFPDCPISSELERVASM
ncbi:hypothetical protein T459_07961 [Capsicum annuum]|uniref:Uncharacterized protein n=1 Tax=Capsicum annuum TaxID=4072 RepID=A0A2G2ZV56_CAPAN|nr:hypothetical protein T459_07961 [Capsicum annuum]